MDLLLDSHGFLWAIMSPERLPARVRRQIASRANRVFVSAATIWELAIKAAAGKIDLDDVDLVAEMASAEFEPLPITPQAALLAANLPPHHRDPFDRMLVAQAKLGGLRLVSQDREIRRYDCDVAWA